MNAIALSSHGMTMLRSTPRGVLVFLLIAFGLAWAAWIPIWLFAIPTASALYNIGFAVGVAAPALATVITRWWITREGFADAGLGLNLRRSWRWYLFAWLWPLLAFGILVVAAGMGLETRKDVTGDMVPALITALAMIPAFFCEEFGWRSYLQIRLFNNHPLRAALATGLIWGIWHYPMILVGYVPSHHGLASVLAFPAYTMLFSILLGALRAQTESVWVPTLAHASNNMVLEALSGALFAVPIGNGDVFLDPRGLVVLIPLGGLAAWIIASGKLRRVAAAPLRQANALVSAPTT